jgi:hypothetical protein
VGVTCSTHGGNENCTEFCLENLKERDHFGDLEIDWNITDILK